MTGTEQVVQNDDAGGGGRVRRRLRGSGYPWGAGSNPDPEGGVADKAALNHKVTQTERNSENLLSKIPFPSQ